MDALKGIHDKLALQFSANPKKVTTLTLLGALGVIVITKQLRKWLKARRHFKDLNIPGPTPWPFLGNILPMIRKGIIVNDEELIAKYGPVVGYFEGETPVVLCSDVNMIRAVMIKDFQYFTNRRSFEHLQMEPFDKILTSLKDDEWKRVRSLCSTTFTSGKLRSMFPCIETCINNAMNHLEKVAQNSEYLKPKQFFGCFTLDSISSCCFGIDIDSINNPDNQFIRCLKRLFMGSFSDPILVLIVFFPKIGNIIRKLNFNSEILQILGYLRDAVNQIVERRRQNLEKREDFIQFMLEHESEEEQTSTVPIVDESSGIKWNTPLKKTLTNKEITCQAILFMMAGYETTATTLDFISYSLATNPDVQDKLCHEIDEALENNNHELNYEVVNKIGYLEMCINETLRKYPPGLRTDRVASHDYTFEGYRLPKGTVWAPTIWVLHHDPKYYPDPDRFDPDRFSDEGKKSRPNEAFIPFGAGPRNCIAMRFAMLEIKFMLVRILSKYKFVTCDKTMEKMEMANYNFARPKQENILKLVKRS